MFPRRFVLRYRHDRNAIGVSAKSIADFRTRSSQSGAATTIG
jgi:hypothetical protein